MLESLKAFLHNRHLNGEKDNEWIKLYKPPRSPVWPVSTVGPHVGCHGAGLGKLPVADGTSDQAVS